MFSFIKLMDKTRLMTIELPSVLISVFVAENFYKFGSFSLELGAFMCTWIGLGYLFSQFQKPGK